MDGVWPIADISPELRRSIIRAANRDGVQVGDVLARALHPAPAVAAPSLDHLLAAIDSCLAEIGYAARQGPDRPDSEHDGIGGAASGSVTGALAKIISLDARRQHLKSQPS